jgi:TolB-like protein
MDDERDEGQYDSDNTNDTLAIIKGGTPKMSPPNQNMWLIPNEPKRPLRKNINHYARAIMQELTLNLQYVNEGTPIAVADFLLLGSNFESSPLIGKQLAEALTHEVHKIGVPVVDYKLADFIRIEANGDIALSRDYLDLAVDIPIRYVLTGTMVQDEQGILINARMVGMESKAIVGSAQTLIPYNVISRLMSHNHNDGLM